MGDEDETIRVGETSEGVAAEAPAGNEVDLPVVDLMTGRGFVTGKSGGGKSNTVSVVVEKLLDRGLPVMVVDIDGEYYGLKEDYEILHVGADEECDLVVNEEHAGKLAELALEQNVPIILDVSSFLDESEARDLLTAVARNLFAKEKKLKQPFLLVVEEVHEYIPEGGGLDECGRMLIKAAKRGRKHGLGVVGVSQRPADVKKDFITQCDWLVWHRLTWENDTKVVRRILGSEYADAIDGMGDGEAFVLTDWSERVRRVQFDRKETFDAGATPGLDDFERPELKSVSSDLVQDLEAISEAEERRESRIQELERQVADREDRIEELESELAEAKDLSKMAERFSRAMMEHVSGRAFRTDVAEGTQTEMDDWRKRAARGEHLDATRRPAHPSEEYLEGESDARVEATDDRAAAEAGAGPDTDPDRDPDEPRTETTAPAGWPETDDAAAPDSNEDDAGDAEAGAAAGNGTTTGSAAADIDAAFEALARSGEAGDGDESTGDEQGRGGESSGDRPTADESAAGEPTTNGATEDEAVQRAPTDDRTVEETQTRTEADGPAGPTASDAVADVGGGADGWPEFDDTEGGNAETEPTGRDTGADTSGDGSPVERVVAESDPGFEREVVREVKATVRGFDDVTRRMLAHYRERGPADPVDAHVAAGGDGDRTQAYSRNRTLRQSDLVGHAGRGRYGCRLAAHLREAHDDRLSETELADAVEAVERAFATGSAGRSEDSAGGREDSAAGDTEAPDAESASTTQGNGATPSGQRSGAEAGDDVLEPGDDAAFIDADVADAADATGAPDGTTATADAGGSGGEWSADPESGSAAGRTVGEASVADATGDGRDQFRPPGERRPSDSDGAGGQSSSELSSDGGEADEFPKWPGE